MNTCFLNKRLHGGSLRLLLSTLLLIKTLPAVAEDCVILLHGLARTDSSMKPLMKSLADEGYQVINHSYPSREKSIEELAESEIPIALSGCESGSKIHFVTHSLGGILLRQYLVKNEIQGLSRVVMLGPPNKGSEVVDKLRHVPGFGFINGKAGMQLGTDENSVPSRLPAVGFELGVIAGTRTINFFLSQLLPNPDDGKVSVERSKVEGMKDHISLPVSHPFLMKDASAMHQVKHFLANGQFDRPQDAQDSRN